MSENGLFIVLEGPDGGGKSTVANTLAEMWTQRGRSVTTVREPGGTASGEMIRNVLLSTDSGDLTAATETLLFYAARAQLIHEVIQPALDDGQVVIADRFEMSTWAYQSCAGGLPLESVQTIGSFATGGLHPDICIVLDLPVEAGIARKKGDGALDRMELKDIDYRRKLRDGYLMLAKEVPYPCSVVDATQSPDAVYNDVIKEIDRVID